MFNYMKRRSHPVAELDGLGIRFKIGVRRNADRAATPQTDGEPAGCSKAFHQPRRFFRWSGGWILLLHPDAAVFHLAAVALEADRAGAGNLKRFGKDLAVAGAAGRAAGHHNFHFVPILRLVFG